MRFLSRRIVMPNDLNPANTLFGGRVLEWIDEEAAIFAICQLETKSIVTKHMGAINFEAPAHLGEIIELGVETIKVGKSSITVKCVVRNKDTKKDICVAEEIVFVHLDRETGKPLPHGKTMASLAKFTD
jgi:acyl-CoA hydrolase